MDPDLLVVGKFKIFGGGVVRIGGEKSGVGGKFKFCGLGNGRGIGDGGDSNILVVWWSQNCGKMVVGATLMRGVTIMTIDGR